MGLVEELVGLVDLGGYVVGLVADLVVDLEVDLLD